MVKKIVTSNGMETLVDDEDYIELSKYKWCAYWNKTSKSWYVIRTDYTNGKTTIYMARYILNCPDDMQVDHINHDTMDNRKSNLRICYKFENIRNRKWNDNNTSGYKGVYWHKRDRKWRSQYGINKTRKYIGSYNNPIVAALMYDDVVSKVYGEFASLNFPAYI